ncbi:MAG: hypothetical protein WAZ77_08925 [Candidatus Nitrosopolaris sp.]
MQEQMTSVRKWHTRIRVASTKERRLSKVLFEINAICSVLCLPKTMAETEALLYRNFENKNEAKGKSITSMAAATKSSYSSSFTTYERATGLETWFGLPDLKTIAAPPRWKMAIVTFIAAFCINFPAQYFIKLYLGQSPLLASVVMNMILVLGLNYFAMPLLSRLLRRWLYPRNV